MNGDAHIELTGVSSNLWRILEVAGLTVRPGAGVRPQRDTRREEPQPVRPRLAEEAKLSPITRCFPGRLDQVVPIRALVAEVARDAGLDADRTFDVQVAVSEAAANAIEHGAPAGEVEFSAAQTKGRLTITISHPGRFVPRVGRDPARSHRGLGMPLMLALTDEVLVSQPPGKGTRVALTVYLS